MTKQVGTLLLVSLGIITVGSTIKDTSIADIFYSIGGLGMYTFGIWGAIMLIRGK